MSKWLAGGVLVLVGVLAGALVLGGGDRASGSDLPNTITVQGTASVRSTPDQATLELGIRAEGQTAEEAFADKGARTDALVANLKAKRVAEDDIQTVDLRLSKRVRDRGTPRQETYFVAETRLEVILRDLDKAGDVAAGAVGAGANTVGGIEFRLGDQAKAKDEALREAIDTAHMKAEAMAAAAGAEVGDVQLIDETNSEFAPYRSQLQDEALMAAPTAYGATDSYKVEPGQVTTQVTATVVYELDT
jgi:uncharacterized protein YggE